jgi:hypothetical protein
MKINKRHCLRGEAGRAADLTARWWTIEFTPDGVDRSVFMDSTLYWSPMFDDLRQRYFNRMYPRAKRSPLGRFERRVNRPKR